jgi:SRSO17 transposase
MATNRVRACAKKVTCFHQRFESCFGRREAKAHSLVYLQGLILGEGRKNVERIALRFSTARDGSPPTQNEVVALQEFLTLSSWQARSVQEKIQAVFAEELVPSTSGWSLGTVGVVDESAFVKRGVESCGVARPWCGRLGKKENCQVGVFLIGVTPAGTALLDHQLYLPKAWTADRARRRQTRVPKEVEFQTKPQIASEQIRRTHAAGHATFDWITADELYGRDGNFLDALERDGQHYVVETPVNTSVWTEDPSTQMRSWCGNGRPPKNPRRESVRSVKSVAESLPSQAWQVLQLREGAKGPLAFEFARVRVWAMRHKKPGPPIWLVIRRSLAAEPEVKYYVANADESTPLETLALVTGTRWRVEEFFENGKGDFGMSDYEARAWTSWHHHMTMVALAHLFMATTKHELQEEMPELTLPLALELMKATMSRPTLTETDALRLTEYHLHRNRIARQSHRKSWLCKHKRIKPKPLL